MKYFVFVLILFSGSLSLAASCCGGSFSFPALILADDKAQVTSTYSYAQVSDEVLANGKWLRRQDGNLAQTLKLEGASLVSDSLQAGFSIPVMMKSADNSSDSSGVGDISLYLGHETFPERTYSRWKPKGLTFLQVTLPTSPSIYDSSITTATDIRGRGFYSLGGGVALMKAWATWDANYNGEIHYSLPRTISNEAYGGDVEVKPGFGTTQTVGLGWNRGDYRVGSALTYLYEDAIRLSGATSSDGTAQRNFTLGFSGSYMINLASAVTVSYSDQSWIGNPVNSSLSKTFNISYQQRWPR
ncbi:serine protease spb1 [Bdellovibrio bacteriovorus]|uniref:Serine protease spb1 n=1 Tax=Bdellovibrio bacteriovorus TaxID=959 RepID=A0A161PQ80_BDEBC|nr:hypothetical protein [Bdellovibrio bacteriovorus]KYG65030.1 serine protease spb1 [Bdellovibrio bacteriovorus]